MRFLIVISTFLVWNILHAYGDDFSTDYCPYISLMGTSKDAIIYANVDTSNFYVTVQSETNGSKCVIPFNESSLCGVSVGKNQDWTQQSFIYWGYDEDVEKYYIRSVYYSQLTLRKCTYNFTIPQYLHSDSIIFKVTYDGLMAYGFDYNYFYFYNLQLNTVKEISPSGGNLSMTPCDLTLTRTGDQVMSVGYLKDIYKGSSLMFASICLWEINVTNQSMIIINCTRLHDVGYHFSEYHPGPKLSIDINDNKTNLIAIGNSANRSIEIFMFNKTSLTNTHTFVGNVETNSVCWLYDGHRLAAVAHLTSTSPWSQSQIQIYDLNLLIYHWPQYIFPNNQQQLDAWSYKNPAFILVSNWQQWNSLIILMDTAKVLVILSTDPGSYADPVLYSWFDNPWVWVGLRSRRLQEQSATPCWSGMYKQENSVILCNVCPPQTKSDQNATVCNPCNQSSFCPLASVDDVDITDMINIHHITSYPASSDTTSFEDILLSTMFSIENKDHCIAVSPLFWALIVISIVSLVLLIIGILKFFPNSHKHRALIKRIFRQTDIIGEGELWIGGLMSFSLFVLIIFAFLFSYEYVHLYPIEESGNPSMTCDRSLRNAQFNANLKLLVATRSDKEQLIFDMLDYQPFTLIIYFVNTNFNCDQLSVLEGTGDNLHEPTDSITCTEMNSTKVIYTSIPTPHEITFKYKIEHFAPIGALYICLIGPENISLDGLDNIKEMHFCRWIANENESIGYTPEINLLFTKVINRTANIDRSQSVKSSGIWQPIFIGSELSDQYLYSRQGEYHRYLNTATVLTIILSENHFYMENNQAPVARKAEISFHTVLFVSLSLEIFGLTFLVFKLIFVPLFRLVEDKILLRPRVTPIVQQQQMEEVSDVMSVYSLST